MDVRDIKDSPYYNDPQFVIRTCTKPHKMFIGGRGVGKTTIIADQLIDCLITMPRGKVSLNGLTYFHIRTKSLPPIIDHWERRGLYRGIHYYIGMRAPKKYGWLEPYQPPLDYTNCIHFFNGFVVEFNSFDRPEMARSGSYDYMIFDESTKLKKSAIDSDVLPANRGNNDRFGKVRFHHGTLFLGSQPLTPAGDWVFDYESLMKEFPDEFMFLEASARFNEFILGPRYFRDLKRVLPQMIYDIEVDNIRRIRNINGFYPSLSASAHCYYDSYNYSFYDSIMHDVGEQGTVDSRGDADCHSNEPLYLSFDFGSTQNCMVVAQWHRAEGEFPIIKNFYVENETLTVLVSNFIDYYRHHRNKHIFLYGGSDGTRRNDASSRQSYFDDVTDQLSKAGWSVNLCAELHEISHMDKFLFWHRFLSVDNNAPLFKINMNNAMETFVSMDAAPVLPQEFKKDKSSERKTDQPRWKATDLSDAVDNLYYWMFFQSMDNTLQSYDMLFLGKDSSSLQ
ncbi:MAG: hypothetical protein NT040_11155 [Bacteroidetes bacterium]|nr:hypothetical protein [Bacteroidota bacterium]